MIFRYDLSDPPSFLGSSRFFYDRDRYGTPTLPKLATEALRQLLTDPEVLGHTQIVCHRVWVWRDNGELIGSIIVRVNYTPRIAADPHTIVRELPT